jgi:hypothetical protein
MTRFGFHIGPFYFSQRLGRTQAQKRAAAKARAAQAQQRQEHSEWLADPRAQADHRQAVAVVAARYPQDLAALRGFTRADQKWLATPEGQAAVQAVREAPAREEAARADHDRRTYRARVSGCRIDGIKGGEFTLEADGRDALHFTVPPAAALRCLSLKAGDIVQVTMGKDGTSLEEFRHLSRANGAKPRSPANLSADNVERHGLAAEP